MKPFPPSRWVCAASSRNTGRDTAYLALVKDDDIIEIDAINSTMNLKISDAELAYRRSEWKQPALKATKGLLYKYAKTVSTAAEGCVTDEMVSGERIKVKGERLSEPDHRLESRLKIRTEFEIRNNNKNMEVATTGNTVLHRLKNKRLRYQDR